MSSLPSTDQPALHAATRLAPPPSATTPAPARSASSPLPLHTVRPVATRVVLVAADLLAFLAAISLGRVAASFADTPAPAHYWPVALGAAAVYLALAVRMRLYPAVAVTPVQELRKLCLATVLAVLSMLAAWSWLGESGRAAAAAWSTTWVVATVGLVCGRVLLYHVLAERPWWGCPVVVIGKPQQTAQIIRILRRQPALNLKPIAVLDSSRHGGQTTVDGVPVVGGLDRAHALRADGVRYAIVCTPHELTEQLAARLNDRVDDFPHLLVIPRGVQTAAAGGTIVRNLGGVVGVELAPRLLQPANHYFKSATDTFVAVLLFLASLPLFAIIALLIKLDSRGPVFYRHTRIGFGGRRFKAIKFRTMVQNAEGLLEAHLDQHPELRDEWDQFHKLRDDPRVTRVGKLLRKPSLDELPQLWNVLKGEMSLIGPRPIVDDEVRHFGRAFGLYVKVRPGITGLWQVSGRSDTTYRERVCLDAYYVRNWTIWMDLYILVRTAVVVLFGRGAY